MYLKNEYFLYVNEYINTYKDDETAYKGDEEFKKQFKLYVNYLLKALDNLLLEDDEQFIAVTESIKRGFHKFKSYEEFTRKDKIEKLLE